MISEKIRAIVKYLAEQKLKYSPRFARTRYYSFHSFKWVLAALILIPALFIGFKWIAPNPDLTSSEEQPQQVELQEEEAEGEVAGGKAEEHQRLQREEQEDSSESQPKREAPSISVEITSVTSLVIRGADATLKAKTLPNATCSVTVYYEQNPSEKEELKNKTAGSNGSVSWTWETGRETSAGPWKIVVTCSFGGKTASTETYFEVHGVDFSIPEPL